MSVAFGLRFSRFASRIVEYVAVAGLVACGGSTSPSNTTQGVAPGDPCSTPGARETAKDGCNTCSCADGSWACTEMACADAGPGSGTGGAVGVGGAQPGGGSVGIGGAQPGGGSVGVGGKPGQGGGVAMGGTPSTCTNGTTMFDGCNSCTCVNGGWACTDRACPPPACAEGATMFDGCNDCTCMNGQWGCTTRACEGDAGSAQVACGARAGDTCGPTEYCAYQPGQYCGRADAQSVCMPRPGACTREYDPVCGCDGNTYGNPCTAASAGTGVMSVGECPKPLPF